MAQTAMQEAIKYLKSFNLEASAIILEDKFLEKEKEQIMKAVNRGYDEGCKFPGDMTLKNAEQYYNDTYTQGSE